MCKHLQLCREKHSQKNRIKQKFKDALYSISTLHCISSPLFLGSSEKTRKGKDIGAAVSLKCVCKGGATETLEFGLSWDMPSVHFRSKEVQYTR